MLISLNTAHLCGHIITENPLAMAKKAIRNGWQPTTISPEELLNCKNYYYGEFVEFMLNGSLTEKQSSLFENIIRYHYPLDKKAEIVLRNGNTVDVQTDSLQLYFAPFGIVIFSIDIHLENLEYNDMAETLQLLRDNCHYEENLVGQYLDTAVYPLMSILDISWGRHHSLTQNGNKLKLFQTVEIENSEFDTTDPRLLYNIGCLQPINPTTMQLNTENNYYQRIMDSGRISIFPDWSALALFDSFSMVASPLPIYRRETWQTDYFGMIYIYSLFRQTFLFKYNSLFRAKNCDIKRLENEILLFERRYCFYRYSYNFLPIEIGRAIERSLELSDTTDSLHSMVTQASAVIEKESDDKTNLVLTILALITICSTVWDLFSMLYAASMFENEVKGFRIGIYILSTIILFLCIVFLQNRRRK